jgi:putative hemolysin
VNPEETLFPDLFAAQPNIIRQFLRSALRLNALEDLYHQANHFSSLPLSTSVLNILKIKVRVEEKDLQQIPRSGPVIFVANHPHGFLDGFVLDFVIGQVRGDLKLLANEMIASLKGMAGHSIAVDVFGSTINRNIKAARESIAWLKQRNSLLMFPSGEVSHWQPQEKRVADGPWSDFAIRCARRTNATLVPVFITGTNSLTFNLAGLVHPPLRTARLPVELLNKRESTIEIRIAKPIQSRDVIQHQNEHAMAYVRARVYIMAYRGKPAAGKIQWLIQPPAFLRQRAICDPVPEMPRLITELQGRGKLLIENDKYAVYADLGKNIPEVLHEIGRLREVTFRQAGEGTGKSIDLDEFDSAFTHLILWHKETASIAGSYRLAWTKDSAPAGNVEGLYTAKLFRYAPDFLARLGPAVELGRSFIVKEHQREIMPLFLLWQAIGHCVACRPDSPILFGAVSISATYSETARAMMVQLLRQHTFRHHLDALVTPRKPFVSGLIRKPELHTIIDCLPDVEDLPIADVDAQGGVPVLLRQYLRMGGKVAGFNLDAQFSNALDALLILDLRETPRRVLSKYMGAENANKFLSSHNDLCHSAG